MGPIGNVLLPGGSNKKVTSTYNDMDESFSFYDPFPVKALRVREPVKLCYVVLALQYVFLFRSARFHSQKSDPRDVSDESEAI